MREPKEQYRLDTPAGKAKMLGWGGGRRYPSIAYGEVVVELENGDISSFKPGEVSVNTPINY